MNHQNSPEKLFAKVSIALLREEGVTGSSDESLNKKRFGSNGIRVHNKIFVMLVRGKLVVKLPRDRVDDLVASKDGERFDPRHDGRLMKEWLELNPESKVDWLNLAKEAMKFVASSR